MRIGIRGCKQWGMIFVILPSKLCQFSRVQVGGVVFAPTVGELQTVPGELENPDGGYRSRFDKKDEVAAPGYYSVLLKDYGVKAELTAMKRVGFHRYTYPKTEQQTLSRYR